jgi:starch synthase
VNKVINNPALKNAMAQKGRKRVEDYFDWISIAKQVEELYKSLKKLKL